MPTFNSERNDFEHIVGSIFSVAPQRGGIKSGVKFCDDFKFTSLFNYWRYFHPNLRNALHRLKRRDPGNTYSGIRKPYKARGSSNFKKMCAKMRGLAICQMESEKIMMKEY